MTWEEIEYKVGDIFLKQTGYFTPDLKPNSNINNIVYNTQGNAFSIISEIEYQFNINIDIHKLLYNSNDVLKSDDTFMPDPSEHLPSFKTATFGELVKTVGTILKVKEDIKVESDFLSLTVDNDGHFKIKLYNTDYSVQSSNGFLISPGGLYLNIFSKWKKILSEFEEILNYKYLKESYLQEFLQQYPEIIKGDKYDTIIPQAVIRTNSNEIWKADFILKPYDQYQFCKILELKNTTVVNYISNINRHHRFSSKLYNAINQLRDYSEAFHSPETQSKFENQYGVKIFKPDLHLIIGRKWDVEDASVILELQRRNNIEIDTWDNFLFELKRKYL